MSNGFQLDKSIAHVTLYLSSLELPRKSRLQMLQGADTAEQIRRALVTEAEFQPDLLERNYRFAQRKSISLAAFAYRPLDARSACVGVVTSDAAHREVSDYRDLGAPLLLIETDRGFDLWRVGSTESRDERVESNLSVDGTAKFFRNHPDALRPMRLYEAKTVARVDRTPQQLELFANFVDPDLLPFVENQAGEKLTATVVAAIRSLVEEFGPDEWIIKAVFRLLAGKILRDKNVPGFKSVTLSHVEDLLGKVERHYGSKQPLHLAKRKISSLASVIRDIQTLGDLRHLTTESLGDVYERALITPDIRKIHGTHKTPGYLVDYVVWQLARWIEEIPIEELRFFEPGCGHAPFLVSLMRLLRTFDQPIPQLSEFVRERFKGVDNDPFALEIARLSLTIADEPNPDGWTGLVEADMYAEGFLESAAAHSTVMLTNPPYEKRKAEELLFRTLPHLPVGAVFGAIVPATLLFSDKKRAVQLRSWMTENCQLAEIDLFPDQIFTFSNQECTAIIGRILKAPSVTKKLQTRLRRVRNTDSARIAFKSDYRVSSDRLYPQASFQSTGSIDLWVAEYSEEVWNFTSSYSRLSSQADVGTGFQHVGSTKRSGAIVVSEQKFPKSKLGFDTADGGWSLNEGPPPLYLSIFEEHISRRRRGLDQIPQVLMNYAPAGNEPWRLKPFIDVQGRPFLTRFLCVRPIRESVSLEYLWALMVSPMSSFFVWTHFLKRDILPERFLQFPVPPAGKADVARISRLVQGYFELVGHGPKEMFNEGGYRPKELYRSLCSIDAEVLRLYDLPAKSERLLLEQFRGKQRPGIPVSFTEYYPIDTPDVPLYAYLSKSYQRAKSGGTAELSVQDRERYEALCDKAEVGSLTDREADRLHELQAEVDGRDYWVMYLDKRSTPIIEPTGASEFDLRLRALSDRAARASILRSKQ